MKFLLLLLAVAFPTFAMAKAQDKAPDLCTQIALAVKPFVEHKMFYGDVVIAKEGSVLCELSVSPSSDDNTNPRLQNSRFAIASLSKPIISALLLRLYEENLVDLDASIDSLLPRFNAPWASDVTVHHLLANRSGLPGHFTLPGWQSGEFQRGVSNHVLLEQIASLELAFAPGENYQYTNLGWTLLAAVIAEVTGESYERSLEKFVLSPLAMDETGRILGANAPLVDDLRWGKQGGWEKQTPLHMQVFDGGAGLYSSALDLVKFVTAVHSPDYLTTDSRNTLFSQLVPYGWRTDTVKLSDTLVKQAHTYDGQLQGHSSLVYHVFDDDLSLVLLNHTGMGFEHKSALAHDIFKAYYGLSLPVRNKMPSLLLNHSAVEGQWSQVVAQLKQQPITPIENAHLLADLSQQLLWSGNIEKAIDIVDWLATSFPNNKGLKQQLESLCNTATAYDVCMRSSSVGVGMKVLSLVDNHREAWREALPRPVTTHLFYPTLQQHKTPLMLGPSEHPLFYAGEVVINGVPHTPQQYPLVLMSHGTGGSAPQMLWLASALVKQGYIVAAVNHHGNTAIEPQKYPEGFLLWWERAADLSQVADQLTEHPIWSSYIDDERIGLVGFSLGGYTTLLGLGGITDKALFNKYCEHAGDDFSCQPQPEFLSVLEAFDAIKHTPKVQESLSRQGNTYRVPNVKAAVAIGTAIVHAFTPESLSAIQTPTLLMVGSEDHIAPNEFNSTYAHRLLPNSELVVVSGARHYSFLSECTKHGVLELQTLCDDTGYKARAKAHEEVIEQVLPFLRQHLNH